ncbi:hypothetical protein CDAR_492751 [Caerostris darwini]|uniref:Uncharacterized protein n=1 Tax=Caerostris darwini TaxID=1538125 RepID=A0AAV4UZI2_9ARAC|nr:hypothetical protein CDAR_492751 [Caerostris darwini]
MSRFRQEEASHLSLMRDLHQTLSLCNKLLLWQQWRLRVCTTGCDISPQFRLARQKKSQSMFSFDGTKCDGQQKAFVFVQLPSSLAAVPVLKENEEKDEKRSFAGNKSDVSRVEGGDVACFLRHFVCDRPLRCRYTNRKRIPETVHGSLEGPNRITKPLKMRGTREIKLLFMSDLINVAFPSRGSISSFSDARPPSNPSLCNKLLLRQQW